MPAGRFQALSVLAVLTALACRPATPGGAAVTPPDSTHFRFSVALGGSDRDMVRDLATDRDGNVYVVGGTLSADFPVTPGVFGATYHTGGKPLGDAFVAKLDPGGRVIWSSYLGGPNFERAYAVEVDPEGNVIIAGRGGAGLPNTAGTAQPVNAGGAQTPAYGDQDGFVCKVRGDGSAVVFCTYFGTEDDGIIRDIAVDAAGDIYLVAGIGTGVLPDSLLRHAFQRTRAAEYDVAIAKLSADGGRILWATYLGGSGKEIGAPSIRVGRDGSLYVLLTTRSSDLPTPGGFDHTLGGKQDLYLARLSPDGSRLLYGTYIGGSGTEAIETHGLALDSSGAAYVTGGTTSRDMPFPPGGFKPTVAEADPGNAFVVRIGTDGRLLAGTYIGGSDKEWGEGIAVDHRGNVLVTGGSNSADFPGTAWSAAAPHGDLFVMVLPPALDHPLLAGRVGGSSGDMGRTATAGPDGSLYAAGMTQSPDWPMLPPSPTRPRQSDGVIVGIRPLPAGE